MVVTPGAATDPYRSREMNNPSSTATARLRARSLYLPALAGLIALLGIAATPTGMAPLPAQYLKERTFHSPDGWFAVDAPSDTWEWFEMRAFDGDADPRWPEASHNTVAWYARDSKGSEDCAIMESYYPSGPMINDSYADGLEDDVRKTISTDQTFSNFVVESIGIPVPSSLRYRYETRKKSGTVTYHFVYVTGWEHKVFLQTTSATPKEPPLFRRLVVSMRWLQSP